MFPRKPLLVVWAVILLATILAGLLIARRQNMWFSDPAKARNNSDYQRILLDPPAAVPAMTSKFLNDIKVDRGDGRVQILLTEPRGAHPHPEFLEFERIQAERTQSAAIGGGSIRLGFIGLGYGVTRTNFNYSFPVPGRFFGPDLAPISHEAVKRISPHASQTIDFNGLFPAVEFCFLKSNLADLKPLTFHAFDARTHQSLGDGNSTRTGRDWFQHGLNLRAWHQTPVQAVATFAAAPVETRNMEAREGAEVRFGNRVVRILAMIERQSGGWSSSSSSGTNTVTLQLQREDASVPVFTIVTVEWPQAHPSPIEVEVFDKAGQKMVSRGGGSMGFLRLTSLEGAPGDIGEIRLKHFTKAYRVVFNLAEIPGLPEENRGLKNLFEARIPYIRLDYEYELQNAVQSLSMMDMNHLPLVYTNGYFPLIFTNATPADLLKEMRMILPPDRQLVVDPEQNRISLGKSLIQQLLDKGRELFN